MIESVLSEGRQRDQKAIKMLVVSEKMQLGLLNRGRTVKDESADWQGTGRSGGILSRIHFLDPGCRPDYGEVTESELDYAGCRRIRRRVAARDFIIQSGRHSSAVPISTVGVMGDERTYERLVAIRAVRASME